MYLIPNSVSVLSAFWKLFARNSNFLYIFKKADKTDSGFREKLRGLMAGIIFTLCIPGIKYILRIFFSFLILRRPFYYFRNQVYVNVLINRERKYIFQSTSHSNLSVHLKIIFLVGGIPWSIRKVRE